VQALGDVVRCDPYSAPMTLAARRQLGGASVIWGGRCVPFDPVDFEPREIVGDARWPVTYDEISRYFQRASDWLLCGRAEFDNDHVDFPNGGVRATSLERWSFPTDFGRHYRNALQTSPRVRLVTGMTCTQVVFAERGSRVDHLEARSLDGRAATVSAGRYVLACGGLETTRLLLASSRSRPLSPHLGRWYMAHVNARIARMRGGSPPIRGLERDQDGVYVRRRFSFSDELLAERGLPNLAIWLVNPELADASHGSATLSLVYLMLGSPLGGRFATDSVRELHARPVAGSTRGGHVRNVMRRPGSAAAFGLRFGYERYLKPGRKPPGFSVAVDGQGHALMYHAEHLPSWDSHVKLSNEVDALGVPRLETHLEFADREILDVLRAHEELDAYLRRHGRGQLELVTDDPEGKIRAELRGGYHQAGLTRMSSLPEDGVVDADLAVHGFDDLYVASSSTFVTSGQAHPTFTIVAFALRLADHLRRRAS
jgi:choline dehydrogenase-like flavoprotein